MHDNEEKYYAKYFFSKLTITKLKNITINT